ncbi:MAG: hypothetical protein DCC75_07895 [Proteobacteria bacterium]|nr:MAG: hypothetical protein DCC75_07895 [Pseudomonadota bacterium]
MSTLTSWDLATVLVGGVATLAIFSFLIKENPFYRFFEHLFIGIAAGWGIIATAKNFLWPKILVPMLSLDRVQYPDGTWSHEYNPLYLIYLAPMAFGLLYYFVYSRKFGWLAKLVIGFSLGASGGLAFEGFFNQVLPQLSSSFKPLVVMNEGSFDAVSSFNNIVFAVTLLSVMYYFFFSFQRRSAAAERFSYCGRWLMMVCFGAYFGSTVMARLALTVERLQFLIDEWWPAVTMVF